MQTDGVLETIADEDAPLKNVHSGFERTGGGYNPENDLKLTEVDQAMPVLPPTGFRTNPIPSQVLP